MKKLLTFFSALLLAFPLSALAAYSVPLIATTTTGTIYTFPGAVNGTFPNVMSPFFFATSTSKASTFPYASSTALSATTLCLTGDTCRTTWPTGGGAWPWTIATNYATSTNATTTGTWLKQGGLFASTTAANPGVAASSDSSGRALEVVSNSTGPAIWMQQNGTNAYLMTGIAKSENVNAIDIAHNPANPTLSTTKSFSLANNTNARGILAYFANSGTNKAFQVDNWDTTDYSGRIASQGYGLYVSANGAGGSLTPFKVGNGTATSTILELNSSGNLALGDFSTISHRLEVGSTTGQNTVRVNGLSTSGNAPCFSLFRSGTSEWTACNGGTAASDFNISANPNSTYTDASLASTGKFTIKTNGNVGIASSSPGNRLDVAGNTFLGGNVTATGTLTLTPLATAAGSIIAVDPSGNVIATTTSAGGVTSVTGVYPVQSTGGGTPAISLAFGTTTANTWSALQTFGNASSTILSATTLCFTGDTCRTTWPSSGAGVWPFTTGQSNFGVAVQSTSTPEWFTAGLQASSTSQLVGANVWGNLRLMATSSALLATDASGNVIATTSIGTNLLTGLLATINGTAVTAGGSATITAASSTALNDTNTWTALQSFNNATSSLLTYTTAWGTNLNVTNATTTGMTYLANTSGNVGIGATSSPSSILSIEGVANIFRTATSTFYKPVQFIGNFSSGIASSTSQAASITVDWNGSTANHGGNEFRVLLSQATNIVLNSTSSNPIDGGHYILKVCQDTVGSRTATFATPEALVWANGTTTVSATANTGTLIGMVYDARTARYDILASSTITDIRTCKP